MTTLEQVVIEAIIDKKEFKLLDTYHQHIYHEELTTKYVNYTLDIYSEIKDMGVIAAKKISLTNTLGEMFANYQADRKCINYKNEM